MAFYNQETARDPAHQGLYIVATGGAAGANDELYQIDPTQTTFPTTAIGSIISNTGTAVSIRSGVFDSQKHLIVVNTLTGQLLNVNLTADGNGNVIAGDLVQTAVGSVTSTIGAIARDPVPGQEGFFAVDNETDILTSGIGTGSSSILVKIKDFTNPLNQDVNFGSFLFDGTVTGRVFVSGTMDRFYAGWLITGDSSAGLDPTAALLNFGDNFHVNGDIHHILSLASIGTDGTQINARGLPQYFTNTEIIVGGKIGDLLTDDEMAAHVVANDATNIPNIADGNALDPVPQTEDQQYVGLPGGNANDQAVRNAWGSGQLVWNTAGEAPFSNSNFNNAQYLGSIRNSVNGQPPNDVIDLQGQLYERSTTTNGPDAADYFAVSLLAGQTITVLLSSGLAADVGIFDPDGRLIATDYGFTVASTNRPITITAAMAGAYRIAVALAGNTAFTTTRTGITPLTPLPYTLSISNPGDIAIGGVVAGTNVLLNLNATATSGIEASTGDIGSVVGGQVSAFFVGDAPAGDGARSGTAIGEGHSGAGTTANHNIMAPNNGIEFSFQSSLSGYGNAPLPTRDIASDVGNIRNLFAGSIGFSVSAANGTLTARAYSAAPDIYVPAGTVGLLETTGTTVDGTTPDPTTEESTPGDVLAVQFGIPAGGDIQHVDANGGNLGGIYRTKMDIGVINAGNMPYGTAATEFHVGATSTGGIGNGGIIDLIDVTGDMGGTGTGTLTSGPAIETGHGGNVRFIHVGGNITPDITFEGAAITAPGETQNDFVLNAPGQVSFNDDSGANVTLIPGMIANPNAVAGANGQPVDPTTGLPVPGTIQGQLATRTYGIRTGGVVIVDVQTNASLTVRTNGGPAEIGNIEFGGTGIALATNPLTGLPSAPANPYTSSFTNAPAGTPVFTTLNFTGPGRIDVFNIGNTVPGGVFPADTSAITTFNPGSGNTTFTPAAGVIDSITNSTGGDIINTVLGNVGTINVSNGNIGSGSNTTLQQLAQTAAIPNGNVFPFVDQRIGLTLGSVATITAGKSIGNVTFTGNVATITTDTLKNTNANLFYGVTGPIVVNGSIVPTPVTDPTTGNVTQPVIPPGLLGPLGTSIGTINIGNGILSGGSGAGAQAGIFAAGRINSVIGESNATVRGTIDSSTSIGSINLPNGSLINARITVFGAFNQTGNFPPTGIVFPDFTRNVNNPFFEIGPITLSGNGGILSTLFGAANIASISVPTGFGILQSEFITTQGTLSSITAGGYGFRENIVEADNIGTITATANNGANAPFGNFSQDAQPTAFATFGGKSDPFQLTSIVDLRLFILGDLLTAPSPSGLKTGAIDTNMITGSGSLGTLTGYQLVNNNIQFANAIGSINIGRGGVDPVGLGFVNLTGGDINNTISAGKLNSFTVTGDVLGLDLEIAGPITTVNITGSVKSATAVSGLTGLPELMVPTIASKGPSGNIGSFTVNGAHGRQPPR